MEKSSPPFWEQLTRWLVPPREAENAVRHVTSEQILDELVRCFKASLDRESIGHSLLFDAHFVIILHPETYTARLAALPVVVGEAVKRFYDVLNKYKSPGDRVVTVASHWHFKFGPGTEYEGQPITPTDVEVIGSLTGASLENNVASERPNVNLKATRKVKNTNVYQKLDLNRPEFQHIDFRESGAFAVKIDPALLPAPDPEPAPAAPAAPAAKPATGHVAPPAPAPQKAAPAPPPSPVEGIAKLVCYVADQNTEETYWMRDREVVIARQDPDNAHFANYIRLTSPYVSNPHARIRQSATSGQFELASFSQFETRLNEQVVPRSAPENPTWVPLPSPSQLLLNGVVTLHFTQT